MTTYTPLQPFCITATSKGAVYAVSFAFLEGYPKVLQKRPALPLHEPDYLVILKGLPNTNSDEPNNGDVLSWTPVTAARRADVFLQASTAANYRFVCGVSEDESRFMLRIRSNINIPDVYTQTSTVQILLSEVLYNNSNSDQIHYERFQLGIDQRVENPNFSSSSSLHLLQDLIPINETEPLSNSADLRPPIPYGDWVHFIPDINSGINYATSMDGSFPSKTQGTFPMVRALQSNYQILFFS